jgi:hypothetical protein
VGGVMAMHPIGPNQDYTDVKNNYFIVSVLHIIAVV